MPRKKKCSKQYSLLDFRTSILQNSNCEQTKVFANSILREEKRPLGKFNIWAFWIELVRGCNLTCWHCPTRLFPRNEYHFMEKQTWISLLHVIQEIAPYSRIEFGNAGEPTLHPHLLEFLRLGKQICPNVQILTYTNGTQLTNGKRTYRELFDAGLDNVFVDMYAPKKQHEALARAANCHWYFQDDKPPDAINVFTKQKETAKQNIIMLAEPPSTWSARKLKRVHLTTFFNDLDWKVAEKHGLKPVEKAPRRRCDTPFKFASVNYDGTFAFCCFDYLRHTVSNFGNINNGLYDFCAFYFGKYMQNLRNKLQNKRRDQHEYCRICPFTAIRCDIPQWKGIDFQEHLEKGKWISKQKEK